MKLFALVALHIHRILRVAGHVLRVLPNGHRHLLRAHDDPVHADVELARDALLDGLRELALRPTLLAAQNLWLCIHREYGVRA